MIDWEKINRPFSFPFTEGRNSHVYLIGIGGIGMSALARFFHEKGAMVSGYDKTPTALTKELETNGIKVHYDENIEWIPKDAKLVIYTPAIPEDHKELVFYRTRGNKVVKRSEVLELITKSSFNICIAGTHGKTTISTMVAHILRDSGFGSNAFLGGIAVNYGTNFWRSDKNVCVIEADEYDRSFLKLDPDIAIITAMDADHLDIYGTAEAMEDAFIDFSKKINSNGLLVKQFGLKRGKELEAPEMITYSLQNENADASADNIQMRDGSYAFDVIINNEKIENIELHMGGMHNIENAVAAMTVARSLEIEGEQIRKAIGNFRGVKRRFEYIIKNERIVFVDDYAHHPEELKALIKGAKALFRTRKCTVLFQPHLFSRTRDLAAGFAEALALSDEVILLPVYPARELPIAGVSSEMIAERIGSKASVMDKEELMKWIRNKYVEEVNIEFGEILITAGAGDIDMLVEPIKKELNEL